MRDRHFRSERRLPSEPYRLYVLGIMFRDFAREDEESETLTRGRSASASDATGYSQPRSSDSHCGNGVR